MILRICRPAWAVESINRLGLVPDMPWFGVARTVLHLPRYTKSFLLCNAEHFNRRPEELMVATCFIPHEWITEEGRKYRIVRCRIPAGRIIWCPPWFAGAILSVADGQVGVPHELSSNAVKYEQECQDLDRHGPAR